MVRWISVLVWAAACLFHAVPELRLPWSVAQPWAGAAPVAAERVELRAEQRPAGRFRTLRSAARNLLLRRTNLAPQNDRC